MKVLSIMQGALGDSLMAFFGLWAVKRHTGADVHLWCDDKIGGLAKRLELTECTYSNQSSDFTSLYFQEQTPELRRIFFLYDLVIVFSFSNDLFKGVESSAKKAIQVFPRPSVEKQIHTLDHILGTLRTSGLVGNMDRAESPHVINGFARHSPDGEGDRPLIIHPGAGSIRKCRPLEYFFRFFKEYSNAGIPVKIVMGPADGFLKREILKLGLQEDELVTPPSLDSFVDLLLAARAYVGNDSGATHLSALLGVPTAAFFGPSDPLRWSPVGPHATVVRPELKCQPCFEIQAENCETPRCLSGAGELKKCIEEGEGLFDILQGGIVANGAI